MKHTKRLMSVILSFIMLLGITAGLDFSAYADVSGDYEYWISDGGVRIEKYNGSDANITIPSSLGGYTVTGIDLWAFEHCSSLISIKIPSCITNIDETAFSFCDNLTSITVASGNKYYSSQNGILFNKNKTELIQYPSGKSGVSYSIPNSIKRIASDAFFNCDELTDITIPDSVTSIGESAFALTGLYNNADNWNNGAIYIDNCLIEAKDIQGKYTILNNTRVIADCAFDYCYSLTDITIPNGVTCIGGRAFYCCDSLKSVTIPNSLTNISWAAFAYCESLKDIYYNGTKAQWNKIAILDNDYIENANIHCTDGKINHKHIYKTTIKKATTAKNGMITKTCSKCGNAVKSTIYYPKTITLSSTSYTYNGKVKKPSITVKDAKGKKVSSKYYTVSYSKGRKNVGQYTVTIKFKGNYSGTVKKTFTIKPKATTISKVTAGKKAFTVKWKKQASQTTGYQIQYSTSSKFKGAKTVTVSKNKTTSKKISKLKAKKKYYVRIRTYKTVKVNGKNTKVYSGWSKSKSVTTKNGSANLAKVTGLKSEIILYNRDSHTNLYRKAKQKISWKKVSGASGYQVADKCEGDTEFNYYNVKANENSFSFAVSPYSGEGIWFIKVRAYKIVNGKKQYGPWSKTIHTKVVEC